MSEKVLIAAIAAVPSLISAVSALAAVLNHRKVKKLQQSINGGLDALLQIAHESGRQEGYQEGKKSSWRESELRGWDKIDRE